MPETGLLDAPTSPINREDTVTNRNPNSTMSTAAAKVTVRWNPSSRVVADQPPPDCGFLSVPK
jgi:hypothetical protein